jgi:Arc/MetJ-type ribon-helix-helix transcriptional regulator
MLERGEALADDADPVTRCRLILDRAWIAWTFGHTTEMAEPTQKGLAIAREIGDATLLSSALDAAAAGPWDQGRYKSSLAITRERLEVLRSAPEDSYSAEVELGDALHMTISNLVQTGEFAEASRVAREARERDLSQGVVDTGWARELMSAYYLGEWDLVLQMAERVRAEWGGRVVVRSAFAADMATPGAVLGCRGDDGGAEEWFALAEAMTTEITRRASEGVRMLRADVLMHRGAFAEAGRLLTPTERAWSWWRAPYTAGRAEAFVLAGRDDAAGALDLADEHAGDNRYAVAMARRARALHENDESGLAEALALFEALGCGFQAARTAWLLGGRRREEAASTFRRLRTPPPVS